jgi:hypothetical protein
MTIMCIDVSPLTLDGSIISSSELELSHDQDAFSDYDDELLNELDVLEEAEIVVPDFQDGSLTHQMHVWEVVREDLLEKWDRVSGSSVSGMRDDMDADIIVVAVPPGVSVPEEPQPGAPAPGTTQKEVKITIRKQGGTPP